MTESKQSNQDVGPCDVCGTEDFQNTVISSEGGVHILDGRSAASVPRTVVCYDCSKIVTDYLQSLIGQSNKLVNGLSPFVEADADALIECLRENELLVMGLVRDWTYDVRFVDGKWKRVVLRLPAPPNVEATSEEEVRADILDAKHITLKHFDPSAWEQLGDME